MRLSETLEGSTEALDDVIDFMAARLAACRANRRRRAYRVEGNRLYPGKGALTVFRGIDDYFADKDFRTPESKKKNDPGAPTIL